MFNLYAPIGINTPVNQIVTRYYMGLPLFYNRQPFVFGNCYAPQIAQFLPNNNIRPFFTIPNYYNFSAANRFGGVKFSYTNTVPKETKKTKETPKQEKEKSLETADIQKQLRSEFLKTAQKYSNCKESDNSHLKFCINPTCKTDDPENEEWCTDFVTYVVKEGYRNSGFNPPKWFGSHDVRTLKNQAIANGSYLDTSKASTKGKLIANIVKPGDIVIFNENKASHTGFVKEVFKDGTFSTIEGNRDDKVSGAKYSPNYANLSGFIQLS